MLKFYDADFTAKLFTHSSKAFREKGVFFVRQNRRLTWKLAATINPYKLRRRRRTYKAVAYLMKQRLKYFYIHMTEKDLRRYFANARHRKKLLPQDRTSYFLRLLERRLDNVALRSGFFKRREIKPFIEKQGIFINGKLQKRLDKKIAPGDYIKFPEQISAEIRFRRILREQYPETKKSRGEKSVWNKRGLRFSFVLGFLKAGGFWLDPRTFYFRYMQDLNPGQGVFYPFDFDASKILKIYQAVK